MKNIFQKQMKDGQQGPSIMQQLNEKVEFAKRRVADYLNARLARLSLKAQRRLMTILGLFVVGICASLTIKAIHGDVILVKAIRPTENVKSIPLPTKESLSAEHTKHLREFEAVMDSLYRSPYGREIFLEIKRLRPGLLDTLSMLTRMK
jgi:hypothetical protein